MISEKPKDIFVAVAGNIGSGKSTLTRMLAEHFSWKAFYEAVDDNPYLEDFYEDMETWSFHSQIYFLARRLQHHQELIELPGPVVQDRTVYEDAEVFAQNLYWQDKMSDRDHDTYTELYTAMVGLLQPPDVIVYLQASVDTLLQRIELRGRDYEQDIDPVYLRQLNTLYNSWISSFKRSPVLIVPTDRLDFVDQPAHFELIASKLNDLLNGQADVSFLDSDIERVGGWAA